MSLKTWESIVSWLDPISQNFTLMSVLGLFFILALVFSFRELWAWYSKTNALQKDLEDIKGDLEEILSRLEGLDERVLQKNDAPKNRAEELVLSPTSQQKTIPPKARSFPLGH